VYSQPYITTPANLRLRILPALGPKRLDELTRQNIVESALKLRRGGTKARNARKTIATLSGLLSEAVDDGYSEANPAAGLKKVFRSPEFRDGEARRAVDPLTREELAHLVTAAATQHLARRKDGASLPGARPFSAPGRPHGAPTRRGHRTPLGRH
jgi:hypothetical protein